MKKVHISFIHNLDHSEFKTFYSNLLSLMQKHQYTDTTLADLQERLQSQEGDVGNLKSRVQKYNNTRKISELTRLRTDYLISFRLDIKSKMLWYDPLVRLAAERLYSWLKHYKKKPFIQSINTQNIVVDNMLARIQKDKSLKADIALLGLDKLMEYIDEITQQIAVQLNQRINEKMLRQKKGRQIRDAAYEEVKKLANYLESKLSLMSKGAEESEHYNLLLEIDSELKDIRKTFRIRTAKDKTRRIKKTAAKQLSNTDSTEMKQKKAAEQSLQSKTTNIELTETKKQPSISQSLTDVALESPPKTTAKKQKKGIAKPKMSRRKVRKLLV